MKKGQARKLEIATRHAQISAQYSIQDLYDLLVEVITNSDDSYGRLHSQGLGDEHGPILVEVERHRGQSSVITICDRAEGIADIEAALGRIGERTSSEGDRGFMARGLKDCAVLGSIAIDTIKEGIHAKADITSDFEYVPYEPGRDGGKATPALRKNLGIPHDGTRVRVDLNQDVPVPLGQTLLRELPWHFALRDIFANGQVKIRIGDTKPATISHISPEGGLVVDEEYDVPGYAGIRARFQLFRSDAPMEDPADKRFRRSGVLICGSRAIHECGFLMPELDRDPAADHYFGRLESAGIDLLADEWDERRERGEAHPPDNPLLIFDPNRRSGLQRNHPFTRALFEKPIQELRLQFDKDREARKKDRKTVEAAETTARLKKLAKTASQFLRDKLEDLDVVSPDDRVNENSFVEKGMVLVPSFTQVPVGQEKRFFVRVAEKLGLPLGTNVQLTLSKAASDALEVISPPSDLEADATHEGIQRSDFSLRAVREARRVQVACQVDGLDEIFAEIQVVSPEPQDVDIPGGFSFHRKSYTVKQGGRRTLKLRARFTPPPEEPPQLVFRSGDDSSLVFRERSPLALVPGTTYYEATLVVEGKKLNSETKIVADADGLQTECQVTVVAREKSGVELEFKLVPYSLGQNWRASWDRREPNKLLITTKHESISRYLGDPNEGWPGQHLAPFRVLLAELIADNVCRRIVEEHIRVLPHEFDGNRIYLHHSRLMKEFTPLAHKVMLSNPDVP